MLHHLLHPLLSVHRHHHRLSRLAGRCCKHCNSCPTLGRSGTVKKVKVCRLSMALAEQCVASQVASGQSACCSCGLAAASQDSCLIASATGQALHWQPALQNDVPCFKTPFGAHARATLSSPVTEYSTGDGPPCAVVSRVNLLIQHATC